MNEIQCEKNCIYQKDGICELQTGIKKNRNEENCVFLTEYKERERDVPTKAEAKTDLYL